MGGAGALPPTPLYSSSGNSCNSTKPAYSTSSVTWLTLWPVHSEIEMAQKWQNYQNYKI